MPFPPPMNLLKSIGKYEILRLLGKGSMGEVYLGRDNTLGREVAIKVIQASTACDAEGKARFEREARAMAALNHPHIVAIFDFGVMEGGHFLAMEYLEGEDLGTLIQQHCDKRMLLEALAQACEGLGYAHGRGIIHRDVKPGNIQVALGGELPMAKLLDFGVASVDRSNLTETGIRMGTVSYMAPEYLDSGKSTPSSDLFAVGVIIYEILSGGRKPFQGEGTTAVLNAILRRPAEPLVSAELQGIPSALLEVMDKALAKDPSRRFATAEALAAALRGAATQLGAPMPQRIVVGRGGDCLSLRVALRQVGPGAVITVLPGHYKETVLVDKDVAFEGQGKPEEIILEPSSGSGIIVETPACKLRGLTLLGGSEGSAVDLRSGSVSLAGCRIGGLRIARGACAELEACVVQSPDQRPGILLESGAMMRAARSTVASALGVGLLLQSSAQASGEECSFQGSPAGSVELGPETSSRFLRCTFQESRFAGVLAFQGAQVTLEECLLRDHEGAGLHVMQGARVSMTACRVQDNAGLGLSVVDGGRVSLEDCEISANGQPGILLHRGGAARLSRCRVTEGQSLGIACHRDSSLVLESCVLRGNALGGILLGPGSGDPELSGDTVLEDPVLR